MKSIIRAETGVRALLIVLGLLAAARGVAAQADVESDPIKCWWKTDRSSVHVAEQFAITLTCGLVETNRISTIVDQAQLEPTTVQMPPFEVLTGVRHEDVREGSWRYFQVVYTLRLVGEEYFGQDVAIPSVKVNYTVQSAQGDASLQGRERAYLLPPLSMRVLSLVPRNAGDIRDGSAETFAALERRRFRANVELVAAATCFAFALVLAGLGAARVFERHRKRAPPKTRTLPAGAVLRGCLREIGRLKSDVTRTGWNPDLAGRALTVFRIAGAVALARPVAQSLVDLDMKGREGQLAIRKGVFRARRALLSAPTTADAIARELTDGNGAPSRSALWRAKLGAPEMPAASEGGRLPGPSTSLRAGAGAHALLEDFRGSMEVFNAARYGRNGDLDTLALDRALDEGATALRRLRVRTLWPVRAAAAVTKSAAGLWGALWSR